MQHRGELARNASRHLLGVALRFVLAGAIVSVPLNVWAVYGLDQWNSWLDRDGSLLAGLVASLGGLVVSAAILILMLQITVPKPIAGDEARRMYRLVCAGGLVLGMLICMPPMVDTYLGSGAVDAGGNLESSGIGNRISGIAVLAVPIVLGAWVTLGLGRRRSPRASADLR